MTPYITEAMAAELDKTTVRIATLAELHFRSATMRVWNGTGTRIFAGQQWQGLNGAAIISELPSLMGSNSEVITATLSGVDPAVQAAARAGIADVVGRPAYFWFQLLDDRWQPIGSRIPAMWGTMRRPTIQREAGSEASGGVRSVAIEIENPYFERAKAPGGRFTDADQQWRFPGDRIFRFVAAQRAQVLRWPVF